MEAAGFFETLVDIYKIIQRLTPKTIFLIQINEYMCTVCFGCVALIADLKPSPVQGL
jgi:hypothetical protein